MDGLLGYVAESAEPQTTPLYGLHHAFGDHFYTLSAEERDLAIANHGYVAAGVAAYVFYHVE